MFLRPKHFIRFMDGRLGPWVNLAYLPTELGVFISAQSNEVRIQRDYARKLKLKHGMGYEQYLLIQDAIDKGYCFLSEKNYHLEFVLVRQSRKTEHFVLVLKAARFGQETWLVTFHRTDEHRLRSKLRKNHIIRSHQESVGGRFLP